MSGMVALIDNLKNWAQEKICDSIELKERSDRADNAYPYKLVHPTAFPVYCPQDEMNRQATPRVPSVTVQLDQIETFHGEGSANIAMVFAVWNPGEHDNTDTANKKFTKNTNGWRDMFTFMDHAIDALEKSFNVGGYVLDEDTKIKARPLNGDQPLTGTYPYFYGEITFSVVKRGKSASEEAEKLL